jgi:hypothetical protein
MFVSILILLLKGGEVDIIWELSKKTVLFQKLGNSDEKSAFTLMFKGCKLLTMESVV